MGPIDVLCVMLIIILTLLNEKALREDAKTARWLKIFAPPQTPFLVAQDGQNLISWRWSQPLRTNPVW